MTDRYIVDHPHIGRSSARRRRALLASLVVLGGLAVGGMVYRHRSSTQPTTPASAGDALVAGGALGPLNDYMFQGYWSRSTQVALATAVARCMADRGWTFEPEVPLLSSFFPATVGELRTFSQTEGYGLASSLEPSAGSRANENYARGLGPTQRDKYYADLSAGDDEGQGRAPAPSGCQPRTEDEFRQGLPFYDEAQRRAIAAKVTEVENSPGLKAAIASYVACMQKQGIEVNGVGEAKNQLGDLVDRATAEKTSAAIAQLRSEEIRVATIDADCTTTFVTPVKVPLETEAVAALTSNRGGGTGP